jgi:hypothetical protein
MDDTGMSFAARHPSSKAVQASVTNPSQTQTEMPRWLNHASNAKAMAMIAPAPSSHTTDLKRFGVI